MRSSATCSRGRPGLPARVADLDLSAVDGGGGVGAGRCARGERAPAERLTHRNGYRPRVWSTRAGEIELAISKIRRGKLLPELPADSNRRPPVAIYSKADADERGPDRIGA